MEKAGALDLSLITIQSTVNVIYVKFPFSQTHYNNQPMMPSNR